MEWTIERVDSCPSTMDLARERARAGAEDGTCIVAATMTAGRGQHDHTWYAPEGGWYASFIVRGLDDPGLLTLAIGNAIADVLEVAGAEPRLKWVNDVLVDGKKIAGILAEAESTADAVDFIVVGVGLNFNGDPTAWPDGLGDIATTLEQVLGPDTCIEDTEPYLLQTIGAAVDTVRAGRREEILAAYRARDALVGHPIIIDGEAGTAEGITDEGHLIVDGKARATGTVTIDA